MRVDDADTGCLAFCIVVDDRLDNRIRTDGQVARLRRPGQRRCIRAEIPAERTAAHAEISRLTGATPLLKMDLLRLRQVRPASLNDVPVRIACRYLVPQMLF